MRAAAVLLVGAALIAGCGGGDDRAPEAAPGLVTTTSQGSGSTSAPAGPPPSAGSGTGTGPYGGPCLDLPEPGPELDWLPEGPPLPQGAYLVGPPVGDETFLSGTLAVPMAFGAFADFAVTEWPSHGWETVQTEVEPGEADGAFIRGDDWGTFVVRRVYCDENWSEVVIEVGSY